MKTAPTRNKDRIATLVLFAAVATLIGGTANAGEVEFVVGALMPAEGGNWNPQDSPLQSPFGVDFNSHGEMWIVELEGGRVHKLNAAGKLHQAGGDGSKSYTGDGGNLAAATFNGMHNCAVTPNGDLYIGDVGQGEREEIDVATAASGGGRGVNYGWNIMEGTECYNASSCDRTGLTLPVLDYTHSDGCSVTGGYVYRGTAIPDLAGTYFYSDYCGGWVRSFRYVSGQVMEEGAWSALAPGGGVPSFGEDGAGELYVLTAAGGVYRIVAN